MSADAKFATKYRPNKFKGYIGNKKAKEEILTSIRVEEEVLPQSIMLVGPSGCGKTTAARLIAKYYMCQHREMASRYDPCETCETCQAMNGFIKTGDSIEIEYLKEIDIAQDRGIAQMDSIKQDMQTMTFDNSWKVYIFDEFHAASYAAQNALLKILEDTPEKVLIIFCTTDESRVLPTIKGRVAKIFRLKKPEGAEIAAHLANICHAESITYDREGLMMLAKVSSYQVRDAIKNLEDVNNIYGDAKANSVSDRFDVLTDVYAEKYFQCFKDRDTLEGMELMGRIKKQFSIEQFQELLIEFITRGIYIINGIPVDGVDKADMARYRKLFTKFTVTELLDIIQSIDSKEGRNTELNLLSLLIRGVQKPRLKGMEPEETEVKEDGKPKDKAQPFANTKKLEEAKRQMKQEQKATEQGMTVRHKLSELSRIVKISENLELFTHIYKIEL